MRFGINKEQWDKLLESSEKVSSMPATVGNFLQYFSGIDKLGNFNMSYDIHSKTYSVGFNDLLQSFESKELIDAMFDLFCYLEDI